jgi:hypothetical protein
VAELLKGATRSVSATVNRRVQRATVSAAGTATVKVTDVYQPSFVPVTG